MTAEWEHSDTEIVAAFQRGLLVGMDGWLKMAVQTARELAPVKTGRLAREIKQDPTTPFMLRQFTAFGAYGVSGLEYAKAHEFGSGIHGTRGSTYPIVPKYAKALAFRWPNAPAAVIDAQPRSKQTGIFFFAKVNHPGVKAANEGEGYLRPAGSRTREDALKLTYEAIVAELSL